jgi:hypothetical protein
MPRGEEGTQPAAPKSRAGSGAGGGSTYEVLEVDAALDDLPAAPGHDGDLHPGRSRSPGGGRSSSSSEARQGLGTGGVAEEEGGGVETGDGAAREWTEGGGVFDPAAPRAGGLGGPACRWGAVGPTGLMVAQLLDVDRVHGRPSLPEQL